MPLTQLSIDAMLPSRVDVADDAVRLERLGQSGAWLTETTFDPFVQLGDAARATTRIGLGTAVAVAFARSPMTVAVAANHLQLASGGRFLLGLGTQVKAHIERRYSMPWVRPAHRMREYVQALRAIWSCWNDRTPLRFEGEFYTHTLMPPLFDPGPNPFGAPPVYLAGVGEVMTAVAGEVADGFLAPPLASPTYIRDCQLPALEQGWRRGHDGQLDVEVCVMPFVVTGSTQTELDRALEATRERIAVYASTPTYAAIFELHGWGAVREELSSRARQGDWSSMASMVDDSMLETLAVVAPPARLLESVRARYRGLAHRAILYPIAEPSEALWAEILSTRPVSGDSEPGDGRTS